MSSIAEKKVALGKLYKELEAGQKEMEAGPLAQARGEELTAKAAEAEALQAEVDQYDRVSRLASKGREVTDDALPPEGKSNDRRGGDPVVGYLSLGEAFVHSEQFKSYLSRGMPQVEGWIPFPVKSLRGEQRFIPLTEDGLKRYQAQFEGKAVPTIGTGVIAPQRMPEVVRTAEMVRLTMRDLFNQQQTTSNMVEYITITPPADPAAAPVAEGAVKPETTVGVGKASAPVRTLAVHMPVTEQQLQDAPQIQGIIDTELNYELDVVEEQQLTWGDGTGENVLGVFNTPNVLAARAVGGDTLLDRIRRAVTDVQVARLEPNAIVLHPYESEALDLIKGTDAHYVWIVVTTADGTQRVWNLRRVVSTAMQEPGAYATPARRVLVGDFIRGATVWDRMEAAVTVGWINNQFITNSRTIRAEERLAFGVKRPRAFRFIEAQARVA